TYKKVCARSQYSDSGVSVHRGILSEASPARDLRGHAIRHDGRSHRGRTVGLSVTARLQGCRRAVTRYFPPIEGHDGCHEVNPEGYEAPYEAGDEVAKHPRVERVAQEGARRRPRDVGNGRSLPQSVEQ